MRDTALCAPCRIWWADCNVGCCIKYGLAQCDVTSLIYTDLFCDTHKHHIYIISVGLFYSYVFPLMGLFDIVMYIFRVQMEPSNLHLVINNIPPILFIQQKSHLVASILKEMLVSTWYKCITISGTTRISMISGQWDIFAFPLDWKIPISQIIYMLRNIPQRLPQRCGMYSITIFRTNRVVCIVHSMMERLQCDMLY